MNLIDYIKLLDRYTNNEPDLDDEMDSKTDDEVREWWDSLSKGQREEVSFYADDTVWARIVAAVGRGAR